MDDRDHAKTKATELLRESGAEGALLVKGYGVLIPSPTMPEIVYGMLPSEKYHNIRVFHRVLGHMGNLCIVPKAEAPYADVLLSKLLLCKGDEQQLWLTGNWEGTSEFSGVWRPFAPPQLHRWWAEKRRIAEEKQRQIDADKREREAQHHRELQTASSARRRYILENNGVLVKPPCFLGILFTRDNTMCTKCRIRGAIYTWKYTWKDSCGQMFFCNNCGHERTMELA